MLLLSFWKQYGAFFIYNKVRILDGKIKHISLPPYLEVNIYYIINEYGTKIFACVLSSTFKLIKWIIASLCKRFIRYWCKRFISWIRNKNKLRLLTYSFFFGFTAVIKQGTEELTWGPDSPLLISNEWELQLNVNSSLWTWVTQLSPLPARAGGGNQLDPCDLTEAVLCPASRSFFAYDSYMLLSWTSFRRTKPESAWRGNNIN